MVVISTRWTYRSGYTASRIRCCSILVPSRKLTDARQCHNVNSSKREGLMISTPYTPGPREQGDRCSDVYDADETRNESGYIKRRNAVSKDA